MYKFILLNLLALIIRANSIDTPDLRNLQDLIKFASEVKEIFSGGLNLKENSIKDESNPVNSINQVINTILGQIEKLLGVDGIFDQFVFNIDYSYDHFLSYASDFNSYEEDTILEFIEIATGDADVDIPIRMNSLVEKVLPPEDTSKNSIWQLMIDNEETADMCDVNKTLQERIFETFKIIVYLEMKALVASEGAESFKTLIGNGDASPNYDKPEEDFIARVTKYFTELLNVIEPTHRELYRCDSETHILGENYVEFEGLFYSYVLNEIEIDRRRSCGRNCPDIIRWETKRCYESMSEKICPEHPCQGLIDDCGWIGGDVDVCEEGPESIKRYRFLRSYTNGWYGKWDRCDGGRYYEYRSAMLRFYSCSTCICTCSESKGKSRAIRAMNLRPQTSNIDENKVVVDVKFVSQDKMIQVQIQQAPLQPNGEVDKSQAEWVPLENVTYDSESEEGGFSLAEGGDNSTLERNMDFAFITKDDNALNIDQISGGPGYVLTGVKFSRQLESDSDEGPGPIELEIRVTPYDYSTGQLNTEEDQSKWIKAADQPNPPEAYNDKRTQIPSAWNAYKYDPDVHHISDRQPNRFAKFYKSSAHSDIGQTVLPLFDSRPVEIVNKLALNGLGLIYRKADQYGGLIAFQLSTISLIEGLNSETSENQ